MKALVLKEYNEFSYEDIPMPVILFIKEMLLF